METEVVARISALQDLAKSPPELVGWPLIPLPVTWQGPRGVRSRFPMPRSSAGPVPMTDGAAEQLSSTVPLNLESRRGTGDPSRTLDVCTLPVKDRDDMVVKSLSWALRELVKRDPESVRSFLAERQHELALRGLREVNNKLGSGLKNVRRPEC